MPDEDISGVFSDVAGERSVLVEPFDDSGGEFAFEHVALRHAVDVLDGADAIYLYDVDFVCVAKDVAIGTRLRVELLGDSVGAVRGDGRSQQIVESREGLIVVPRCDSLLLRFAWRIVPRSDSPLRGHAWRIVLVDVGTNLWTARVGVAKEHVGTERRMRYRNSVVKGIEAANLLEASDVVQESAEPRDVGIESLGACDAVAEFGHAQGVVDFERYARIRRVVGAHVLVERSARLFTRNHRFPPGSASNPPGLSPTGWMLTRT